MFDICSCQCTLFDKCSCKKELKVPVREREFLTDQRTLKLLKIGDTDKVVSNMLKRKHHRQESFDFQQRNERKRIMRESTHSNHFDSSELSETEYQSEDENLKKDD